VSPGFGEGVTVRDDHQKTFWAALLVLVSGWGVFAWLVAPDYVPSLRPSVAAHQWSSLGVAGLAGVGAIYCLKIRDRLPDELARTAGGMCFEQDGLCFCPVVRVRERRAGLPHAEICLYYQSRYSGPCEAVVHLRPKVAGAFYSHRGARDLHFAFRCGPGGFGVVHQPVAVPEAHQGKSVEVLLAAAVRWPKTHRAKLRSRCGQPVGWFAVDWQLAYRQSEHELGGELELHDPASVTLRMPDGVVADLKRAEYFIEPLSELEVESA